MCEHNLIKLLPRNYVCVIEFKRLCALSTCVFYVTQKFLFFFTFKKTYPFKHEASTVIMVCWYISQWIYGVKYMRKRKKGREEKIIKWIYIFMTIAVFLQLDITFRLLSSSSSLKNQQFPFSSCFALISSVLFLETLGMVTFRLNLIIIFFLILKDC